MPSESMPRECVPVSVPVCVCRCVCRVCAEVMSMPCRCSCRWRADVMPMSVGQHRLWPPAVCATAWHVPGTGWHVPGTDGHLLGAGQMAARSWSEMAARSWHGRFPRDRGSERSWHRRWQRDRGIGDGREMATRLHSRWQRDGSEMAARRWPRDERWAAVASARPNPDAGGAAREERRRG